MCVNECARICVYIMCANMCICMLIFTNSKIAKFKKYFLYLLDDYKLLSVFLLLYDSVIT